MPSILVVSEIFYPEGGGAEKATYLVLEILARHGFKITVFTGSEKPAVIPGVKYYITPYLKHTNRIVKFAHLELLANGRFFTKLLSEHEVLYIPLYAYPLIPVAKKKGLHVVVHVHNYMPVRYSSVKYFFEPDAINIYDELKLAVFHEYHVQRSLLRTLLSPLSFAIYLLGRKQVEKADKLICVSKKQAEIIAKSNPHLQDKIEVVYNPMPPELLIHESRKELEDIPRFMYVGGDSYIKGFHILLRALKELGKQGIKAKFILVGSYSARNLEILKRLSKEYGNLEIQVVGKIRYEKIPEIHKKAWALIFPSISDEPLPYAIVEAIMLRTIPIASKIEGVIEIVERTPAINFTFQPGDAVKVVEKIKAVSSLDRKDLERIGSETREMILRKFDLESINGELTRVFTP